MATGTDPLQREQIGVVSHDTGARYEAPTTNGALQLAASLGEVNRDLQGALTEVAAKKQQDAESQARISALETSGAKFADAVRLGQIKPTQNPWFMDAYEKEAAAIRGGNDLSQLQTDSTSWEEKNDPAAFATKWRQSVADLAKNYDYSPEAAKGFLASEGQVSQQVLATNQATNSARIVAERQQNVSALAADQIQRTVQEQGGHISGSQAALALAPVKQRWIATGGSLTDWNIIMKDAVTTASYSIRSPGLIDLLKDPALINGPRENDTSQYGDGTDDQTPDLPKPLQPVVEAPPAKGAAPAVSTGPSERLQPPALGRITNTFAQHTARGSAGVDIAVPIGTSLTTPVGGVAHVGQDPRSGLFVKVTSPDGRIVQVLAHLSHTMVQDGQQVGPGTVVGASGQSGDATGPHVHWQLKVDGHQVDPFSFHPGEHLAQNAQAQAAPVAAGEEAPALAPAPPLQTVTAQHPDLGPSLYDMAGVADAAESDRYRISQAVRSEATDKLQAITASRRLDGLKATDQLYATFGTKLLTGGVTGETIVNTLAKANYSGPVIAEVLNNIHSSVSDTAGLASARMSLNSDDPGKASEMFNLAVEGRTKGYSPDLESRIAAKVMSGDLSATEAASMVGEAVTRTENLKTEARAQQSFDLAHPPGAIIRKASDVAKGIDLYTGTAVSKAESMFPGQALAPGSAKLIKERVKGFVSSYLTDHPGDYEGAETQARNYVANFLRILMSRKGMATTAPSSTPPQAPAAAGGNPRR